MWPREPRTGIYIDNMHDCYSEEGSRAAPATAAWIKKRLKYKLPLRLFPDTVISIFGHSVVSSVF